MKIYDNIEQGTDEWLALRAGKITASEADAILTPLFAVRDSKGVESYLGRKLAEKWMGRPILDEKPSTMPMDVGEMLERENRGTFMLRTDLQIREVGFIETDDGLCGCSPDGLTSDDGGLEIKSPLIQTHCKYLLAGVVPPDYIVQVHFSMFVTGYSHWFFMSGRRLMPPLIIRVARDEKIISAIAKAVDSFRDKMDAGWKKLVELNLGEEPKRTPMPDSDYETELAYESQMPS
jgi:hypothetical protein